MADRTRDEGVATTQLVIAMPALLTMLLLIVQLGLWFHASHLVHASAQEGARAARAETGTAAAGEARARDLLANLGRELILDTAVDAQRSAASARVEVTGHVRPVLPGLHLPVRAVAEGPLEQFLPP